MTFISNSTQYPSIVLDDRQLCDLELILNGGFSPLNGFMKQNDYLACVTGMRLGNGHLWSMPIVLPINESQVESLNGKTHVTLKDKTNLPIAIMDISKDGCLYQPDIDEECQKVYGSTDTNHPYVKIIKEKYANGFMWYLGGEITEYQLPKHYDFQDYRLTPEETKKYFQENGWTKVVGFQTRNPMHKSHYHLTQYALDQAGEGTKLLLHPVVGITQECDVNYHTRVRCYQQLIKKYPENTAILSLLPLSMRMAGPREAVWHAQIRKNYGCTHFVVGRDHAGPSYKKKNGESFYGPYDAQDLLTKHAKEIGIELITSKLIVYAVNKETNESLYAPIDTLDQEKYQIHNISGTQQREMLRSGEDIPAWFSFPDIIEELRHDFKPLNQQGVVLYFVGLSGSGKSTLANNVISVLKERVKGRNITLLDADIIRQNLSKGLGFSKEDRSTNVRRIGFVASEIAKHHGVAVVANIAPYQVDRDFNRKLTEDKEGNYIEIFVDTPLEECENRDCKGLYKLARAGKIKQFTGIDDPFDEPVKCQLKIDNTQTLEEGVNQVIEYLESNQFL